MNSPTGSLLARVCATSPMTTVSWVARGTATLNRVLFQQEAEFVGIRTMPVWKVCPVACEL
eukprot:11201441-Lingulodinium_polyedra.AAC.1